MPYRNILPASALMLLCLLSSFAQAAGPAKAPQTETPPTLAAAALLPKAILTGPNHTVDNKVINDGYMTISPGFLHLSCRTSSRS